LTTTARVPSIESIFLDATAPMLQPRELAARLQSVRQGGVDAFLSTVASIENFATTMQRVSQWLEIDRTRSHGIRIARSVADMRAAKAASELSVVLHFQGADPIEDQPRLLDVFHACGMRVMQITYNLRNRLGDGCFELTDAGLSKFGRQIVKRMETLGIVVDLAHAGHRTALEVADMATRPVVVTHANARALFDTPRNVSDDVIRAVAASGGVIGVCAVPFFLAKDRSATLDTLIDHAAYIADLVGVRHVGLGLDFAEEDEDDYVYFSYDERYIPKPPWVFPSGITGHAEAGNIATRLKARGFAESDVQGILGENFLSVFRQVWGG
jgi:membrane dipeptidase